MEALHTTENLERAAARYRELVDSIRDDMTDEEIDAVLLNIQRLPQSGTVLRNKYDVGFYVAIEAQLEALHDDSEDAEETRYRADMISLLVGNEGIKNTGIRNTVGLSDKRRINGHEYKLLRVCKARETAIQTGDDELVQALDRYAEVSDIIPEDFDGNLAKEPTKSSRVVNVLGRQKDKLFTTVSAVVALTTVGVVSSASSSAATEKLPYDEYLVPDEDIKEKMAAKAALQSVQIKQRIVSEDTRMKNIADTAQAIADNAPIVLNQPKAEAVMTPTRVKASPPPPERVDGSIALIVKEVTAPPTRTKVSPPAVNIAIPAIELPPDPNKVPELVEPEAPAPAPAPAPEVIIDPSLAGETMWTAAQLEQIRANLPVYLEVEKETGVEWEIMAALHVREYGLKLENPANGQGIYQLYSTGEYFAPGPVSVEEFKHQTILAANFILGKANDNSRVGGPFNLSNPDKVKDALFAYNGLAAQYFAQAEELGFTLGAEGSPYVMNLADDQRNSAINPNWGQILTDNGPLGVANQAPGAWPLIEGLVHINKVAHDKLAAAEAERLAAEKKAAEEAARIAEEEAQRIANEKAAEPAPFSVRPIQEGLQINSGFGPRGDGGMHTGIDYPADVGLPFIATVSGKVSVHTYDASVMPFCINTIESLGYDMSVIKDPLQKDVHITTTINGDVYTVVYAHLSEVYVAEGEMIKIGSAVGETGGSGCSTGAHAHYEILKNGVSINPAELHANL